MNLKTFARTPVESQGPRQRPDPERRGGRDPGFRLFEAKRRPASFRTCHYTGRPGTLVRLRTCLPNMMCNTSIAPSSQSIQ
jgi:hypothetical protein